MRNFFSSLIVLSIIQIVFAQGVSKTEVIITSPQNWVDSVFKTLTPEQKIAQLMIIRAHSNLGQKHINEITELINQYNVGGLCFFQGGPVRQAQLTNFYQGIAKTPLMICIDGEWGLGMRLDSVINFPRQLMMGAVQDTQLIYQVGRTIGEQCKRIGIHVNYAPVIDINNNPNNPVINDRSFGEDKYKVASFGIQYMKGMQDVGVMACAKHFPGHGDVAVDSHYDLPVINKSIAALDSLELYPFQELFKAGVGSVMVAHLYIPGIDATKNQATSLSKKSVTGLLRNELGYKGLIFTDALEMQGVAKFYPAGEVAVQSLIAGNDMLCLPADVPGSIQKIMAAIKNGKLSWVEIDEKVKKVLLAKYNLGLHTNKPIEIENLTADINKNTVQIKQSIAANALTLLKNNHPEMLPLAKEKKLAYIGIGVNKDKPNAFSDSLKKNYNADVYFWDYKKEAYTIPMLVHTLQTKYEVVVIGVHNYSRRPANNFGLSNASIQLVQQLQHSVPTLTFTFGNPYAIKNISNANNLIACYEDDEVTQQAAFDLLQGKITARGKLPVTINKEFLFGAGIIRQPPLPRAQPESIGFNRERLNTIDSIVYDAISQKAIPGCVVLVAKDGKIAFEKAYGFTTYNNEKPVTVKTVYDLASVTKISATTLAVMKLYEEGELDLDKTLGDYLPWVRNSDKAALKVRDVLLHEAGLVSFIPFFKETIDIYGNPKSGYYHTQQSKNYPYRVAENMYLRKDYVDSMYNTILNSKLGPQGKYVYSDNDFIFLGKIIEQITGKTLSDYVKESFYEPLNMFATAFQPRSYLSLDKIAPTEQEKLFRMQLLTGDVHDPGAAMFGGVAGHAGLFSTADNMARLYQMLLNGGNINGQRFLKKETIDLFTAYNSNTSRRGLGFDKPEKDNAVRDEPYPSASVSAATYGHTGFTGTCVWVDPEQRLIYIFLSNRVHPNGSNKMLQMNVRGNIQEAIYNAIIK